MERTSSESCSHPTAANECCVKVLSLDGRILQINDDGLSMLEIDDVGLYLGRTWSSLWPEEGAERVRAAIEGARKGRSQCFEAFAPTVKGTPKWWQVTVVPIREGLDQPVKSLFGVSLDITDHRRVEGELAERSALLDTLLQRAPIGLCFVDPDFRFVRVNKALASVDGAPVEAYRGKRVRDMVPRLWPKVESFLRRALAGETVVNVEISGETDAVPGEERDFWASYYPVRVVEEVIGVGVVVTEVTTQRRAEKRVRESQERLSSAVDAADVGTWRVDLATGLDTRDVSLNRILGLAARETTQPVGDFFSRIHPEDRHRADLAWTSALEGAGIYDVEVRVLQPSGTVRWVRDRGRVVRGPGGEPNYVTGAVADITDRKEAEALREREVRFENIANTAPAMLWMTDENHMCTFLSQDWTDYTGQAEADGLGLGWTEVIHPDDRERASKAARSHERRSFVLDYRVRRADGRYRWARAAARPRFSQSGEFLGYIGSVVDINERKEAEDALKESNRCKDEFLAMLGHELRNPLSAIRSAAELAKRVPTDDARLRRVQGVLDRQSLHMTRLIEGLLEVTRIARGKIVLDRRAVDLRGLLREVLQDRTHEIGNTGVVLAAELPDAQVYTSADYARLVQVFDNLLGNAIKFTDRGGRISVVLQERDGFAEVRVRDTGAGIRPEMLPRIFDPFQQEAQEIARTHSGLGLGLALVKGLVELHGGTVEAHSRGPGTGAEFVVRLPLGHQPSDGTSDGEGPEAAPQRILIVEDIPDTAQMLRDLLELRGHDVSLAETAPKALDLLRGGRRTDIVLCDIGLPGMSGYDLAREIRSDHALRSVGLVALTGYGQPEDRIRTREAGFDAHLTKPVDLEVLDGVMLRLGRQR